MPTYTYACASCGAELERRQSFSDAPLTECEACGGDLRRVLHPVGVIFKGSGFYNTDYKKAASNGSKATGDDSKEGGTAGESKKSDPAKAESKSDSAPATSPNKDDSGSKKPAATNTD